MFPVSDVKARRTYLLVMIWEVVIVAALWLTERIFS